MRNPCFWLSCFALLGCHQSWPQPASDAGLDASHETQPEAASGPECLVDQDGDGYGSEGNTQPCPPGQTPDSVQPGDCDDAHASVRPGLSEVCGDGLDNDCNGTAEDVSHVESCDGRDDDCDGASDEGFAQPLEAQVWTQPGLTPDGSTGQAQLLARPQGGAWLLYEARAAQHTTLPSVYRLDERGRHAGESSVQPARLDGSSLWTHTRGWLAAAHGGFIALLTVRPNFYPRAFDLYVHLYRSEDFSFVGELMLGTEGELEALTLLALSVVEDGGGSDAHVMLVYARQGVPGSGQTRKVGLRYRVLAYRSGVWEQPAQRDLVADSDVSGAPVMDAWLSRVPCRREWLVRGVLLGVEPPAPLQRVVAGSGAVLELGLPAEVLAMNVKLWSGQERCEPGQAAPELLLSDRQTDKLTLGRLVMERADGSFRLASTLAAAPPVQAVQSQGRWLFGAVAADQSYAVYEVDWQGQSTRPLGVSAHVSIGATVPLALLFGRNMFDLLPLGDHVLAAAANTFRQDNLDAHRSAQLPHPDAPAAAVTYRLGCLP